jgi:hypothetical protein
MDDPVIWAIREIKERLASDFDYDIRKIFSDIRQKETASGRKIVNLGTPKQMNVDGKTPEPLDSSAVQGNESDDFGREYV